MSIRPDTWIRKMALEHGKHLVLRVRPQAGRRVLLTGHMDTVFPASHPFQQASMERGSTTVIKSIIA